VHLEYLRSLLRQIVKQCVADGIFEGETDGFVELIELMTVSFYSPWLIAKHHGTTDLKQAKTAIAATISGLKACSRKRHAAST
jgi:hypothetical protein